MSMELYVLRAVPAETTKELQKDIDDLGFQLRILAPRDLIKSSGHLPAEWHGREAGFELSPFPPSELTETYPETDFRGAWPYAYSLCFGTLAGCVGASIAAAALAKSGGGLVFDPQEDLVMSADDAATLAAQNEKHFAKIELVSK